MTEDGKLLKANKDIQELKIQLMQATHENKKLNKLLSELQEKFNKVVDQHREFVQKAMSDISSLKSKNDYYLKTLKDSGAKYET